MSPDFRDGSLPAYLYIWLSEAEVVLRSWKSVTNCAEKSAWQFEHSFDLDQGFVVTRCRSHMEASGGSNEFQMQPFLAVGFVFGLAGSLATTCRSK